MDANKNRWQSDRIIFVCCDSWPTPESGIMLKKVPFPYLKGRVFSFWLTRSESLPFITGQQRKSWFIHCGDITRPAIDYKSPEGQQLYAAARGYFKLSSILPQIIGQTGNFYIAEVCNYENMISQTVLIDKKSFEVRPVVDRDEKDSQIRQECLMHVEDIVDKIKPGQTRKELEKYFHIDGGLSYLLENWYVFNDCPFIKIKAGFELTDPNKHFSNNDKITYISKPYFEESYYD